MMPYRSREEARAPREAAKTGLVADMVRQFADVFAFVRELVQNGIDAGASAIEVAVDRASDGITAVRVSDDGCGMAVETIEDALLVLFRSTKDEDPSKIGKYGVGFMSVLAIEPTEVTVDTWRDGQAHRVRLFTDHSYEIEQQAPREGHGTSVAVIKTVPDGDFEAFWQDVTTALYRWCRHAELPIHFTLLDGASAPRRARADVPLDVRAAVRARASYRDGMEIVVGPIAGSGALPPTSTGEDDPAPFAGFYNRGLTLHETSVPLSEELSHVRFKVKSAQLLHTLSRDDVRRDRAFHLALSRAAALCKGALREAALRELAAETEKAARDDASPRLEELLEIALAPPISAGTDDVPLPLAHPIDGRWTMTPQGIRQSYSKRFDSPRRVIFATKRRTELTGALASHGVPVLLIARSIVALAVDRASRGTIVAAPVGDECMVARELSGKERLPGDVALCAALGEALASTGVRRVAIGALLGERQGLSAVVDEPVPEATSHVLHPLGLSLARWTPSKGALVVLNAAAEAVDCARRATSPAIAAHLLARYLLLAGPGLSSKASEKLAIRALEQIR